MVERCDICFAVDRYRGDISVENRQVEKSDMNKRNSTVYFSLAYQSFLQVKLHFYNIRNKFSPISLIVVRVTDNLINSRKENAVFI